MMDLYEFYLEGSNDQVLDMFNVKYIITRNEGTTGSEASINSDRYGAAWFVDSIIEFSSANQELLANYAKAKDLANLIWENKGFAWW